MYWLLRELYLLFCLPALDMHAVDVDEHLVIPEAPQLTCDKLCVKGGTGRK